jgi:thioredoxin-related protein
MASATVLAGGAHSNDLIKWQKYDEALRKAKENHHHVLVNFSTKWCGYCKKMDASTYRDSGIVATLNEYFELALVDGDSYDLVKLQDGDITEKGLTRQYGVRGYPTTWLLEPDGTKIAPVRGYVDSVRMQYILDFVLTNSNEKMSFKEFVEQEMLKQGKR